MLLLAMVWGWSFLFIKEADRGFAPLQVTFLRLALGALTLLVVLAARREPLPRLGRTWFHLAVAGLFGNAMPYALYALGEEHVTSVLAGIINATTPLMTVPFALLLLPSERPTAARLGGLAAGFVGVLLVLAAWQGMDGPNLEGSLLCLGAAACYGLAFPYTRRFLAHRPEGPLALAAAQLVLAAVEVGIAAALFTDVTVRPPTASVLSVGALGILGTGLAYAMNYSLVRDAGATTAATVTYIVPVFSTLVGVAVLGEPLAWNQPAGMVVIVLAAALAQGRIARRRIPA